MRTACFALVVWLAYALRRVDETSRHLCGWRLCFISDFLALELLEDVALEHARAAEKCIF